MSEVRPEQDSNRKEKANKKMGGLWTKKGQFTWLCFHFGQGMFHVVAFNFKCNFHQFTWIFCWIDDFFGPPFLHEPYSNGYLEFSKSNTKNYP